MAHDNRIKRNLLNNIYLIDLKKKHAYDPFLGTVVLVPSLSRVSQIESPFSEIPFRRMDPVLLVSFVFSQKLAEVPAAIE